MDQRLQRRQTAWQQFRLGWPLGRSGLARQRGASLASARRNDSQEIALGSTEHAVHKFNRGQSVPSSRISRRVDPLAARKTIWANVSRTGSRGRARALSTSIYWAIIKASLRESRLNNQ